MLTVHKMRNDFGASIPLGLSAAGGGSVLSAVTANAGLASNWPIMYVSGGLVGVAFVMLGAYFIFEDESYYADLGEKVTQ